MISPGPKTLRNTVAKASPEEKLRVVARLSSALEPFDLTERKRNKVVAELADRAHFYFKNEPGSDARIFNFQNNVNAVTNALADALGYEQESAKRQKLREDYVKAACEKPQLFYQQPGTILCNITGVGVVEGKERTGFVTQLAKKLGYEAGSDEEKQLLADYVQAALVVPQLFTQRPETILCNIVGDGQVKGEKREGLVTQLSRRLGYADGSPEAEDLLHDYVSAVLDKPELLTRDPNSLMSKITQLMEYGAALRAQGHIFPDPSKREAELGIEKDELLVHKLFKSPTLLLNDPEVYAMGFIYAQNKHREPASIRLSEIANHRKHIQAKLVHSYGGRLNEEIQKEHPEAMGGHRPWTQHEAQNYMLRALSQSGHIKWTDQIDKTKTSDQPEGPVL